MHLISGLFLVVKDGSQTQNKPQIRPVLAPGWISHSQKAVEIHGSQGSSVVCSHVSNQHTSPSSI